MKSTRRPLTYFTMALLLAMNSVSVEVLSDPAVEAKPPVLPVPLTTPQDQSPEPPVGAEVTQDDKLVELETIPLAPPAGGATLQPGYGRLPMRFEPNQGQSDSTVKFLARGPGYQLFLTPAEAVLVLRQAKPTSAQGNLPSREMIPDTAAATPTPPAVIRIRLEGMTRNSEPILEGGDRLPGYSNYLIGKDPAQWRTQVPHYAKVRYAEVYPGIDLVYYGNPQQLEYDFVVAPGADPGLIQLAFTGVEGLEIDTAGNLILNVADGRLVQQAPRIWQVIDGERLPVEGRYVLRQPDGERLAFQPAAEESPTLVGFQIAHYQPDLPLVIDPVVLSYSTYIGGISRETAYAIAVDNAGHAYLTGETVSADFPVSADAAYPSPAGIGDFGVAIHWDAFIVKLNADGTALDYATYLGGEGSDSGRAIAVGDAGTAYVTGDTGSENFPVTAGAAYTNYAGGADPTMGRGGDAFVVKLNATGSALDYATLLGGEYSDSGQCIALDDTGNAYVTGYTYSCNFPVTAGAAHSNCSNPNNGGYSSDAFVAKLNSEGSALDYATYLGGGSGDSGQSIAVDSGGHAYITGSTYSSDFPTTPGARFSSLAGGSDVFVAKLNAWGSALDYATYLGGGLGPEPYSGDYGRGIAVDDAGSAYVTGYTYSNDFPVTPGAAYPSLAGMTDAFVVKLNATGTALEYATYLGGSYGGTGPGVDYGQGIAVDARGLVYVTGTTESSSFPVRYAPYADWAGGSDAFLAVLAPDGGGLVYGSFLGGSNYDYGYGVALDNAGNAYVTGSSTSSDFPTTAGAFDTDNNSDAFVAKFAIDGRLLLVNRTGGGGGLISSTQPDGTIDCGPTCSAIHPTNTIVRLLAATQPVSTFAGWGGDCAASGVALTCNLTLATDRTVSANFVPRTDDIGISQVLDLDQSLPGIDWYQAGSAPWFAQDRVTHDGVDAAQSGAIGDNQSSELEATVTGPAYLSFWWKVSSEQNWDYLRFFLDGVEKGAISGERDWTQVFVYVPAGAHTLTWAYEKDETGRGGQDAGWLDGVVFDNADRTLVIELPIGGTITGAGGGSYPLGTALTLVAEPATGYYFGGWGGDCQSVGMDRDCDLVMDVDKRVSAVFIQVLQGEATTVAAGAGHSCAVAEGGVRCWGDNDYGQLGNGSNSDSLIPVQALPPGSGASAVAAGGSHSCAVVEGGVQCWGAGGSGQLGNGSYDSSLTPVWAIPAGSGAITVAAGEAHSCAVVSGGVKCWGASWSGQLGNGSDNSSSTPVQAIPAGKGATAIAAGYYHSCAVIDNGVQCWGGGGSGQLGNGSYDSSLIPVWAIPAGSGATAVATGDAHSCAVIGGGVQCWGYGYHGQLGNGNTNSTPTPVWAIPADSGAAAVAAGDNHSCAVVSGGVRCWGAGWYGQLGNGSDYSSSTLVQAIPAGNGVTAVAAGGSHTCAVVDGGVKCWGDNGSGQLGDGTQSGTSVPIWTLGLGPRVYIDILNLQVQGAGRVTSTPPGSDCTANCTLRYPAPTTVTLVATAGGLSSFAGWEGDCAAATGATCELTVAGAKTATARFAPLSDAMTRSLDLEGAVWTNGGNGSWFAQERVTHDGIAAAQSGAIGDNQTSALSTTLTGPGYLSFWWKVSSEAPWDLLSFNLDGELQGAITGEVDWTPVSLFIPAGEHTLAWSYLKDVSNAGGEDAGWLDQLVFDNAPRALVIDPVTGGTIGGGATGTYPPDTVLTLTATAASGHYFAGWGGDCAGAGQAESCELILNSDKRVWASFLPLLKGTATDVAAGGGHSCAVADGGVRCWGDNGSGQLGNGTTTASLIPVQAIPANSGASAVATGSTHSCAVVAGGVQCWGFGGNGQLGNGNTNSSSTPVQAIPAGSGATAVATGDQHSCAVVVGGVQCWGHGDFGQLGNGSQDSSSIPVWAILAGSEASAVATGAIHSCAVVGGGVKCWGDNGSGQLGNGSTNASSIPVKAIPAGSGASAIAAAGAYNPWYGGWQSHSCAVVAGGVQCWGNGSSGQLGNDSTNSSTIPVQAIPAGSGVSAVAAAGGFSYSFGYLVAEFHSCAVVAGGIQCWGANGYGQLGNGSTNPSHTPVQATPAGSGASAIAAGGFHSCALVAGGIQCWGDNGSGQLGDGTRVGTSVPVWIYGLAQWDYVDILNLQVQGAGRVISTPPGNDCTANCTLRFPAPTTVTLVATAGGLSSFSGWEGDCAAATGATCELTVAGAKTAIARFAPLSDAITRSLDLEGAVWTEGGDAAWFAQERVTHDGIAAAQSGAIGDNQTSALSTTLGGPGYLSFWWKVSSEAGWDYLRFYLDGVEQGAITGETDWTQFSLYLPAGSHTLTWVYEKDANDAGGEDAGWLDQLVFDNANRTLVIDPPTGGIVSGGPAGTYPPGTRLTLTATADSDHYFAGWGGDCAGTGQAESCELTLNSDKRVSASFLPLLKGATTDVAAGIGHSCAVAEGGVRCWGSNYNGQLGNGTTIDGLVPVQAIPAGSGASAVAAGGSHSCAVIEGGVQCWGNGGSGQLGNGSFDSSLTPVWAIPAGSGVSAVATGDAHSCAVVGGGVQCWGDGSWGQLGNGTSYSSSSTPVQAIPAGKGTTAVAAGYLHSCAVVAGGIKCWGDGGSGQLGNGSYASSLTPVQTIPAGSGASAIAAAGTHPLLGYGSHSCAVVSGGVQCWGSGGFGQLGNGSYASSPTPVQTIPAGSGASAVTAGAGSYDRAHSCAVVASGVQCWGSGEDGQLGKGSYESSLTPVHPFPAGSEASKVAAGYNSSCAVLAGGVQCWGSNGSGQLGDGTQEGSAYPRPVIGLAADLGPGIPVTATAGPGGSISPPWVSVPSGATTSLTVTPDVGFSIADVSGCAGSLAGNSYTTGAITSPCTVNASFSQNSYLITATANPEAGGTVTCVPNSVTHGGTSRCTAEVASGYGFVNWGGDCSGSTPTCTLTNITGPREVTANLIDLSATLSVTQSAPGYQAGGLLQVSISLNDTSGTSPLSLLWRPHLPAGWTLASVSGDGSPELSQDGSEILFTGNLGAMPLDFSYQIAVPADAQGQQVISATVEYQNGTMTNPVTLMATPNPLILDGILYHSADYRDPRWQIDSSEASRVLAYWRAGVYHVEASGEDGYAPGTGGIDRNRHSADYQAPYWWIDGSEANRVLAYWRAAAYHADADGVDGFAPGVKPSGAQAASRMAAAATTGVSAGHRAPEYQAGEILTVTNTLERPVEGALLSLLWTPSLPTGWSISAVSGDGGPELGPDGQSILFTGSLTANPLQFSYQVAVPADANGEHSLSAVVEYQTSGAINAQLGAAQPQPLVVQQRVLDMKTLAVTTNPASTGSGTVTGSGTYPAGTRVTVSAIPDQGSAFAGWEPTSCGAPFALTADTVCQATFNPTPPPPPVTVFADSFESTSFTGRWTQDSQNDWFVSTQRRTVGSRSAEVDGSANNAQLISVPIATGGASSATITFSWFNETSLDTNEYLAFDVSTDGGTTWTEKARLRANADPENAWRPVQVNLTGLAPTASLRLRFRGTMSDSTEDANLDNVIVTVNPTPTANQAPSANAGGPYSGYAGRSLVFSANDSSDADGTLVSYVWDFGDGNRGVGATASHTYASPGDYDVTLTVTDNGGATATDDATASLTLPPPNQPPLAGAGGPYTGTTGQALTVSAAGSTDADGSIVRYEWDFGDGTTGTGMTTSHTYTMAGTYTLTVTVTDDVGDTDVATTTATVVSAPVTVFADSFESNSFAGRWTQDSQNDWYVSTQRRTVGSRSAEVDGSASNAQLISVPIATGGASSATITFSWFNETSLDTNEYLAFDVSTDGGTTWTEQARLRANQDPENAWRPVQVNLTGLAPTASLRLRFRGTMSDSTEDANLDNVIVTVNPTPTANQAPSANAGGPYSGYAGRSLVFSANDSSDADGTLVSYVWDFGDGNRGVGATASHTYASPGDYDVTLTVTDNGGATATDDTTASLTLPPPNQPPLAGAGGPYTGTTGQALTVSAAGSTDADGSIVRYDWDFGDGTTGTGMTASHTYTMAGTYTLTVTVTDDVGDTDVATTTATVVSAPVTVFADSFESTSFTGRWTQDSQNDWFVSTQRRTVGSRSAEVDGSASNAQLISVPIATGGASSATITFSWFNETSLDTNEYLAFDVSTDGGITWTEQARLRANVDPENAWRPVQVNLTGLAPTASLRLRFRGTMSDSTEDANLDNVIVRVQ